jgi:hypothetical protein
MIFQKRKGLVTIRNKRRKYNMSLAITISEPLATKAIAKSRFLHRTIDGQIEYWAKIGQILEDNQS